MSDSVYREEALAHRRYASAPARRLDLSPRWTWAVSVSSVVLSVATVGVLFLAQIDLAVESLAMVYPRGGVHLLSAENDATVATVVRPRATAVQAGTVLATLTATTTAANRTAAREELALVNAENADQLSAEVRRYASEVRASLARDTLIRQQLSSLERSVASRRDLLRQTEGLWTQGLASSNAIHEAREAVEASIREVVAAQANLEQLRQERGAAERLHQDYVAVRQRNAVLARVKTTLAEEAIHRSHIEAPVAGFVDHIYVRPGDFVRAGTRVARLVADGPPSHIVTVIQEDQRRWLRIGDIATVSLDQLPREEFGWFRARIVGLGREIAEGEDLPPAIGSLAATACYRVDLELLAEPHVSQTFRTGMLGKVRFRLRKLSLLRAIVIRGERWAGGKSDTAGANPSR